MTLKTTDDTADLLKSTDLEKEQNRAPAATAPVAEPPPKPKPPPQRTVINVRDAIEQFPEVRAWFVTDIVHLLGRQSVYELSSFFGTTGAIRDVIGAWMTKSIELRRDEARFKELLAPHKLTPIPAKMREAQTQNVTSKVPRIMRPAGPSDFASTIGLVFELLALEKVASRASLAEARKAETLAEAELVHALDTWTPFGGRLTKKGAKEHPPTPHGPVFSDEMGQQLVDIRLQVHAASEVVRQRERLRNHLKELRGEHKYLVSILTDVSTVIEERAAAQRKLDENAERRHEQEMVKAGYDISIDGKPFAQKLDMEKTQ